MLLVSVGTLYGESRNCEVVLLNGAYSGLDLRGLIQNLGKRILKKVAIRHTGGTQP